MAAIESYPVGARDSRGRPTKWLDERLGERNIVDESRMEPIELACKSVGIYPAISSDSICKGKCCSLNFILFR